MCAWTPVDPKSELEQIYRTLQMVWQIIYEKLHTCCQILIRYALSDLYNDVLWEFYIKSSYMGCAALLCNVIKTALGRELQCEKEILGPVRLNCCQGRFTHLDPQFHCPSLSLVLLSVIESYLKGIMQQVNHLSSMRERDASLFMALTSAGVQCAPQKAFIYAEKLIKLSLCVCDCFNYQCVNV